MKDKAYTKNCQLESCGKVFHTNLKWQEFCRPAHQIQFHKERRRQDKELVQIIRAAKLEKAIGALVKKDKKT